MSNPSGDDSGNRFSAVDDDHHGGILWITASLSLTYFVLSCILRVYLSYRQLTKDALCLVAATVFGFVQVMLVFAQLRSGYGTSIDLLSPSSIVAIQKDGYAADLLFVITLALSKVSVVWFMARLTPNTTHSKLCIAAAVLCLTWGIASVLSLAIRCDPAEPWIIIGKNCTNLLLRWQLISAFDFITEVVILIFITGLVFNLQMPFEKKFIVVLGFTFRLPLVVLAILHIHYVQSFLTSTNSTFDQITVSVIMSVQLGWSLISATIPCLRAFVANLGSGYLGATLNTNLGKYGTSGRSGERSGQRSAAGEESYVLNKISVSQPQETEIIGGREHDHPRQGDAASNRSTERVSNDGSQEFIIRKTINYQISYQDNENPQGKTATVL